MPNNTSVSGGRVAVPQPMTILVTGANGFVGHELCDLLQKQGYVVRGAVRNNNDNINPKIAIYKVGEINSQTDWSSALDGIDCVMHLAGRAHVMHETSSNPLNEFRQTNVIATEHLARSAASRGVKRLVFVSSIKVNGEGTASGKFYTEQSVPAPLDPYGISKWEAEEVLHRVAQETGLEVVIVRPPLVYGPGVKGNFERMLKLINKGIPLPFAAVKNLRSMIFVGNLADALKICAINPAAAGKTYLLSDGEDISTPNLLRQLAHGLGKPMRIFNFPNSLLKFIGKLFGKAAEIARLLGSLQVDSSKIRRELNWQPPFTLHQGLQLTTDWFKNSRK